jgi:thioredoxin-like negative regulator of GroEL
VLLLVGFIIGMLSLVLLLFRVFAIVSFQVIVFLGFLFAIIIVSIAYLSYQILKKSKVDEEDYEELPRNSFVREVETDEEAKRSLLPSGIAKMVLVHANWCGHCRDMMPVYLDAAFKSDREIEWIRIDAKVAPSVVRRSDLKGFPTIYGIKENGELSQHSGGRDLMSLMKFAESLKRQKPVIIETLDDSEEEEEEGEDEEENEKESSVLATD